MKRRILFYSILATILIAIWSVSTMAKLPVEWGGQLKRYKLVDCTFEDLDISGDLIPDTDNSYDLGSSSYEYKDLYIDGIGYIDAISGCASAVSTAIDAGASGTAGSVDVFPATASRGKLTLACTDQAGDTAVTVNANAMEQATQVNIADPGAAASYVVQSTAAVSLAEADVLDGVTPGTVTASKALVVDASKDISGLNDVGVDGTLTTADGVGALAGTNVTVSEVGNGAFHRTVLTLAATPVTLTDEAGVILYGGQKLYDFPEGAILVLGVIADIDVTVAGNLSATADGDVSIGTATAGNDADLTSTEADLSAKTTIAQLVASTGPADCMTLAALYPIDPFDGTGTAKDLFLNFIWDDADHDGGTMTVTGTVTISWVDYGDY